MEWELFFERYDGNKWPDSEIIKHLTRLVKNKNLDKNNYEIFDFGCGSGNNVMLYLTYCKRINCIDISTNALDKLRNFYKVPYQQGLINLINTNLEKDNLLFLEKGTSDLNNLYVDCTCFQHIKVEALNNILDKIKENSNTKNNYLISKTLCYESQNSSFRTNINDKNKILDLYSKYGNIEDKTYSIIEENFLKQEFLTITINL